MAEGGKALAEGLKGNQALTELDLAGNALGLKDKWGESDTSGVVALADAIRTMEALTSLDVSDNSMCGWSSNTVSMVTPRQYEGLISLLGSISTLQQLNLSSNNIGADGATHVADAIRNNGALTSLDIRRIALV